MAPSSWQTASYTLYNSSIEMSSDKELHCIISLIRKNLGENGDLDQEWALGNMPFRRRNTPQSLKNLFPFERLRLMFRARRAPE
jgi:hypothetical protein